MKKKHKNFLTREKRMRKTEKRCRWILLECFLLGYYILPRVKLFVIIFMDFPVSAHAIGFVAFFNFFFLLINLKDNHISYEYVQNGSTSHLVSNSI